MLLNHLRPSAVFSAHFPNSLPTQRLDNLRVTHQAQVTRRGLSHEAVFFSYEIVHGITYILPRGSQSPGRRGHLKASLTKRLPLLHHRYIIRPPHHLPQAILLRLAFSTPTIGHERFTLSGIRGWRLMLTWNQPPRIFL